MTHAKSDLAADLTAALADLPVFPLPGVVLFPRALLPLHIFEPRYRAMVKACLETHRTMAMAIIPDPNDLDAQGQPKIARVAGVGVILEHQPLPDGRSNILLQGRARVELTEVPSDTPYRRARATLREERRTAVGPADRAALVAAATALARDIHQKGDLALDLPAHADVDVIADLCAAHLLPDARVRQAILEEQDVATRVRMVIAELALQHRALHAAGGTPVN
jgi:ATP-dependent Lon protease